VTSAQSDRSLLEASGFFDPDWYRQKYPDVEILGMDPMEHFLWLGSRLLRSPGPDFNSEYYMNTHKDVARNNYNPVMHYIRYGRAEGRRVAKVVEPRLDPIEDIVRDGVKRVRGEMALRPGRPTVMLCSHVAGQALFGGERSFIDMIDGLNALDYNVIVTVPGHGNPDYFNTMRRKSVATYVFRYGWWRKGQEVNDHAVTDFACIIQDEGVDVVHTNTIVLREPLLAARRIGVRSMIHVRELIHFDEALLNMIGESAEHIVKWIWDNCDHVIANSKATLKGFAQDGNTPSLVYNTADFSDLTRLDPPSTVEPMRVGLISSNLPKKGIKDFADIAQLMSKTHPDVKFNLIGPETEHTNALMAQVADGRLPKTLTVAGYRDTPTKAVAEADVILNLSNFQESFGRTVLEGMAAGRPTIVYQHGAPPEFVDEGKTGFIVPLGDIDAVAAHLRRFADDRALMRRIGEQAKVEVTRRFDRKTYAEQMRNAYDTLNSKGNTPKKITLAARANIKPTPRDAVKIAYFCWHFPVPSETFVLNELRILRDQGFDVRVFCRQSPYPDFKPDFDIEWERVTDPHHLAKRLQETGRTIVHAHFVYPTVTNMVWPACEEANIPFTCIAHAQDIFRHKNAVVNRIDEFSRSPMCRKIMTLSQFHMQFLVDQGVPSDKILINSNCVDPDLFAAGKVDNRAKRTKRSVCAVTRFAEKKGLEHLIRAGKLLEGEGITINIYGYGELEDDYRKLLAEQGGDNVHLHGPVKGRDALMEVFRQHDLFACPSVRAADGDMDGIPTTLMESMAAGLPVLTTDVAGIPDLVSDKITGLVCDARPEEIAARIRAFYAWPDGMVQSMIENAEERLRRNHHGPSLVENLVRVWANERIDLLIVSWNNIDEITEVTRRLFEYTSMPFHLIICDNGSGPETLTYLMRLQAEHDNVTLILNRENALVGPGTNICLENGQSDYAIYVCGKEGMTTRHGWEKSFITYMNMNPEVGLAGTLCHSPTYLYGRDYPKGQSLFDQFRNKNYAHENPDKLFAHVQGGFFVMRRSMIDKIGAFSEDVPHSSTDVEFSYYVESCGWKLGEVPGLMALFNKTRPGLFHRVDETMGALHPPMLEDLRQLDAIARAEVHHCNACGKQSAKFEDLDGVARCPHCGASRRGRSLHRALAESTLLYRRLLAMGVNVPQAITEFWTQQFQGKKVSADDLAAELKANNRTDLADGRLDLIMLNDALGKGKATDQLLLKEVSRLLRLGGTLIIAGAGSNPGAKDLLKPHGLVLTETKRYASKVSHYDWKNIRFFTKGKV
jgi:glycosyltransferase involved in cell wall biosynthesis